MGLWWADGLRGVGTAGMRKGTRELGTDTQGGGSTIPNRDHPPAAAAHTEGRCGQAGGALAPTPTLPQGEEFSVCAPDGWD